MIHAPKKVLFIFEQREKKEKKKQAKNPNQINMDSSGNKV